MPPVVALSPSTTSTRASPHPDSIEMRPTFDVPGSPPSHLELDGDLDDEVETLHDDTGLGIGKGRSPIGSLVRLSTMTLDMYSIIPLYLY
jgi:hypothetical protein